MSELKLRPPTARVNGWRKRLAWGGLAGLVGEEVGEGGGFGVEGGDGFDEAGDGKGVAHAAGAADEAERAVGVFELDGDAHEGGNAGAVNLRDAVEVDDDVTSAGLEEFFEGLVEMLAGFADGQAAADIEDRNGPGFAHPNFHWRMINHRSWLAIPTRAVPGGLPAPRCRCFDVLKALYDGAGGRQEERSRKLEGQFDEGEGESQGRWYELGGFGALRYMPMQECLCYVSVLALPGHRKSECGECKFLNEWWGRSAYNPVRNAAGPRTFSA